jgi:uncharacterized membrane protein YgdD (TMEM256/DUF423 family)
MNSRFSLLAGSLLCFAAVAFGAFGAHAIKNLISSRYLEIFETGVRYHFLHAFALLFCGLYLKHFPRAKVFTPPLFFFVGILLFSGSLYILALTGNSTWGMVTPIGGVFFLMGWLSLSGDVWKHH